MLRPIWVDIIFNPVNDDGKTKSREEKSESTPRVLVGYDTRDSSPQLADEVREGVEAMHGLCLCFSLITTPQLHFAVCHMNLTIDAEPALPDLRQIYVQRFASCFSRGMKDLVRKKQSVVVSPMLVNVDCANGVGSIVLDQFRHELAQQGCPFELHLYNTQTKQLDWLNNNCGADFVQTYCKAPQLYDHESGANPLDPGSRWATIDGDADRILYFYVPDKSRNTGDESQIILLDGDRIACLFAMFIKRLLPTDRKLTIGVIQTAYANAASSIYLEQKVGVPMVCVSTGMKYLHRAAQKFDFGIAFEASGHGTVSYSPAALERIESLGPDHPLSVFAGLTNTTFGDGITGILMVEYALAHLGWSMSDWANLYKECASRRLRVAVAKPYLIQTVDSERRVSHPSSLQDAIDKVVDSVRQATGRPNASRAFVRPAGTENTVRVYAESTTQPLADWLATKVAILTHQLVRGVGDPPMDPGPMPLP
ncbi:unnamed protein product [Echinostoma caproni]|uniref:Phosphoacetylglucosamine mutase n=1 Tax=Echinostoma caproni TaxID=27848 RepID=A0A183AX44_9TREM|nr:unnamed protein product [Echinostoma caproni]